MSRGEARLVSPSRGPSGEERASARTSPRRSRCAPLTDATIRRARENARAARPRAGGSAPRDYVSWLVVSRYFSWRLIRVVV